jgi:hypothetical protein
MREKKDYCTFMKKMTKMVYIYSYFTFFIEIQIYNLFCDDHDIYNIS